ncbi:MAG TPA: dynamin family protein [Hyphomicrobiaceae bacterium]|nr:dynamin family protein [Hyphomicrobiaceae bacterium]
MSVSSHEFGVEQPESEAGAGSRIFATRQIGAELETIRRELVACGRELQSARPFRGGSFVDDMLKVLEKLTCRIAIIGQVKAGKSTFINGLVRSPGLLPTDVNPWTTAVTHLHFARSDAPANVAAEFTFFDANEWERLARGGGHLRELTERLVPGFEAELLQKHVDAMRRRSEERLGSTLRTLLGKMHQFPSLSTEVLERYVCSGLPNSGAEHKGIYSDVVKSADLYFRTNDFGFPTTIIDTPGTNDPFLVRDEITRRALESADIYIVALTARQALSSADVALLRILRGLHKERITVFINRIDELGDLVSDVPAIVKHVQSGLRREFPSTEIPVVAGSAMWAETAIRGDAAEVDRALSAKVAAYAGIVAPELVEQARTPQQRIELLFMCSGLSPLCEVLSRLTMDSHTGRVLAQVSRSFSELARVGQNAATHEVEVLETEGKSGAALGQQQGEIELRAVDAEVKENERLTITLQSLLTDLQARSDRVIEDQCSKMVEILRDVVLGFAEEECENLRNALAEGHRGRVWKSDATHLRQRLEEEFVKLYREADQEIAKLESNIFPKLKQLLARYRPDWQALDESIVGTNPADLPLLSALSKVVALDLGEPWWKHWWTRDRSDSQLAELDTLIRREFYPIVDELAQAARAQLKARQSASMEEANMVFMGLVELLKEQSRARLERTRALITGDSSRNPEVQRSRDARAAELKDQISQMDDLVQRLETIEQTWGDKTA